MAKQSFLETIKCSTESKESIDIRDYLNMEAIVNCFQARVHSNIISPLPI